MTSSSSDSEDENVKRFMEAVDTTLINDAMFQSKPSQEAADSGNGKQDAPAKPVSDCPKSNRYLVEDENVFQSDLNVTDSMKKFIGKKLSALIEQKVSFVEVDQQLGKIENKKMSNGYGVKLLRDSDSYLTVLQDKEEKSIQSRKKVKPVKKRVAEVETISEQTKIELAAVDADFATHKLSQCWTNRPKAQVFEYKGKGPSFAFQEPANEFSKMKRKNSWNDSKISAFRKKNKPK